MTISGKKADKKWPNLFLKQQWTTMDRNRQEVDKGRTKTGKSENLKTKPARVDKKTKMDKLNKSCKSGQKVVKSGQIKNKTKNSKSGKKTIVDKLKTKPAKVDKRWTHQLQNQQTWT